MCFTVTVRLPTHQATGATTERPAPAPALAPCPCMRLFACTCSVWRMCPHAHHPSPEFQALMQPLDSMNHYDQQKLTGAYAGTCWLDGFLIWPVPASTTDCSKEDPHLDMAAVLGPVLGPHAATAAGVAAASSAVAASAITAAAMMASATMLRPMPGATALANGASTGGNPMLVHNAARTATATVLGRALPASGLGNTSRVTGSVIENALAAWRLKPHSQAPWQQQQTDEPTMPALMGRRATPPGGTSGSKIGGTSGAGSGLGQMFCIHRSTLPVMLRPGSRPAQLDGLWLPAPEDLEAHVAATYGPHWRQPDDSYHGVGPDTPDVDRVRAALHRRLSVTAWGDVPWGLRQEQCKAWHG